MDIFVGNLSFEATEADVKKLFEGFGDVASVFIAMEREKTAPKSRGFGFVQMLDERQALAAIAVLNGREFMGRVLNVGPVRPKTEAQRKSELKKRMQRKVKVGLQQDLPAPAERPKTGSVLVLNKPGTYRGGRRTRSYINRLGLAGVQAEIKPLKSSRDNPLRWRKKKNKPK
jgi:RNA recognition motif-containing protein